MVSFDELRVERVPQCTNKLLIPSHHQFQGFVPQNTMPLNQQHRHRLSIENRLNTFAASEDGSPAGIVIGSRSIIHAHPRRIALVTHGWQYDIVRLSMSVVVLECVHRRMQNCPHIYKCTCTPLTEDLAAGAFSLLSESIGTGWAHGLRRCA